MPIRLKSSGQLTIPFDSLYQNKQSLESRLLASGDILYCSSTSAKGSPLKFNLKAIITMQFFGILSI